MRRATAGRAERSSGESDEGIVVNARIHSVNGAQEGPAGETVRRRSKLNLDSPEYFGILFV